MQKTIKKITMLSVGILGLQACAHAAEMRSDSGKIYFGIEGGYSMPLKKHFKEKSGVIGKLHGTEVYEGKVGYMFYPNLAVELSYSFRPRYKLRTIYPDTSPYTNMTAQTKVASHAVMLSLVYFAQTETKFQPYFLAGVGYAHVTPKRSIIYGDIPAFAIKQIEAGNVKKFTSERLGIRLGGGVNMAMTDNLALSLGGKIEIINNIALHAQFLHPVTKQVVQSESLKKTIGVAELTAGLRYSL